MIQIDGSYGEGGGQILRTSVALSALTGKPVKIYNIRAGRPQPGLRPQHLKGIEAVGMLCDAKIKGLSVGSEVVEFIPGELRGGRFSMDVGTAGSLTLVLQALMIPVLGLNESIEFELRGGTDVKWSPQIDYLRYVLLPLLEEHGYRATITLEKRGYYPKGGGLVRFKAESSELKSFSLTEKGEVTNIGGISHASLDLSQKKVAERQSDSALEHLRKKFGVEPEIDISYSETYSTGSGITLWINTEKSILGSDSLGERGRRAEDVGLSAAKKLIEDFERGAVDSHMADQLIPYLGIVGGKIKVPEMTGHCRTNIWATEKFLDVKFSVTDRLITVT